MDEKTKKIIKLMKRKREKDGLSLRKLSDKIGVSFSTLARIERGDGTPDNSTKVRILNWLGDSAREAGIDFSHAALVHFRAAKNIEGTTIKYLLEVANTVKKEFETDVSLSIREMELMALEFRKDLELEIDEPLDPLKVGIDGVKVITLDKVKGIGDEVRKFLEGDGCNQWSAMSIPIDEDFETWVIVRNQLHNPERQRVSILEEYWHILLGHELTKIVKYGAFYGRSFENSEEHDAYYLASASLLPQRLIKQFVKEKGNIEKFTNKFCVSKELVEYRIKRLGLWWHYKPKTISYG